MKIQCPNCGKEFKISNEYEGKKAKCVCKSVFIARDMEKLQSEKTVVSNAVSSPINNTPTEPIVPQSPPPVKCSKCGSTQIMPDKKGFGGGKAFIGGFIIGPLGILAGMHGSKKVVITCLNCGHKWQLEDN